MTTTALPIDKRTLMLDAWAIVRARMNKGHAFAGLLSQALSAAWFTAKMNARIAAQMEADRAQSEKLASRPTSDLIAEITVLENRTTLGHAGVARLSELRRALDTAKAREADKRAIITGSAGRLCSVTFIKKDGTLRTMKVQPAALAGRIKGEGASDAGKRAAATRKVSHPNLLPVWDVEAGAPRSINLATVTRIAAGGHVHRF